MTPVSPLRAEGKPLKVPYRVNPHMRNPRKINTHASDRVMTPCSLAHDIVKFFHPTGKKLEPCKGTGSFMRWMPEAEWCEISEGKDFFDWRKRVNWIITNPPYTQMREFFRHSMEVSNNVVFLMHIPTIFHKSRIRDMQVYQFGLKTILMVPTPKKWAQSGFQLGAVHVQKDWIGPISLKSLGDT